MKRVWTIHHKPAGQAEPERAVKLHLHSRHGQLTFVFSLHTESIRRSFCQLEREWENSLHNCVISGQGSPASFVFSSSRGKGNATITLTCVQVYLGFLAFPKADVTVICLLRVFVPPSPSPHLSLSTLTPIVLSSTLFLLQSPLCLLHVLFVSFFLFIIFILVCWLCLDGVTFCSTRPFLLCTQFLINKVVHASDSRTGGGAEAIKPVEPAPNGKTLKRQKPSLLYD